MDDLPAPLVGAEVDLRGTAWMPYFGHLLRGSELNASVSDAGFRAAHNLWWASWNQVPAASLPDNDRLLARFADLGTNMLVFQEIKDEALHGFILCSDGRYYHKFLAPKAIEAWEQIIAGNARRAQWRDRKAKSRGQLDDVTRDEDDDKPKKPKHRPRAGAREGSRELNGKGSAPPGALNPKILGHSLPCACSNCSRWVKEHATPTANG